MFILHVGRHKCGSSSIQGVLSENADRLQDYGILYPRIARPNAAHHLLATHLKANNVDELDEIIDLKRRHPEKTVVLSSEGLGTLSPTQISYLKGRIGACETLIVIYIRDLIGWLPSAYSEGTKVGANLADFDAFYARQLRSKSFYPSRFCNEWASVFGWQNLHIRSLDSRSLSGGALIDDFLSTLGLSPADLGDPDGTSLRPRNTSLGWKVLEVLRAQFAQMVTCQGAIPITWEVGAKIRNLVVRILTRLELNQQRTQYLSARQIEESDQLYRLELQRLNESIADHRLPFPEPPIITERPFLPSLHRIPIGERSEIAYRMEAALFGKGSGAGRDWDRRFAQAGIGSDLRRYLIDALATDESKTASAD